MTWDVNDGRDNMIKFLFSTELQALFGIIYGRYCRHNGLDKLLRGAEDHDYLFGTE